MTETFIRRLREQNYFYLGEWLCEKFIEVYPLSLPLKEELAIFYFYTKRYQDSFDLLNKIIDTRPNDDVLERCLFNKRLMMDKMVEDALEKVDPPKISLNPLPLVTFSITTCRRLDLFKKTMDSFLTNCTDHNLISRWICVDDNSLEDDRVIMKERYPFMEFIWKSEDERGHTKSMQIIASKVKTPYLLHMEDDWLFFDRRGYISDMIEVLQEDPQIGQVLINKNYTELPKDTIAGGHLDHTKKNLRYFIHEHCVNENEKILFALKYGPHPHCNYWPHYSLRPSLINTEIYDNLEYNDVTCFENDFAQRYVMDGYKSAFLQGVHSKHIGRLTSERNNVDKLNAYDLLDVDQFSEGKRIEAYVINLNKRPDRYKKFLTQSHLIPFQVERVSACDGKKLVSSPRLRSLFEKNDYHMRRGIVGCALSHLKLITDLAQSTTADYYLIFEDDVVLNDDFDLRTKRVLKIMKNDTAFAFLAHTTRQGAPVDSRAGLIKYTRDESFKYTMGGAMCYIISVHGAKALLEYIDKHSMTNAIDTMMQLIISPTNKTYYLLPTVLAEDPVSLDTNIQNDFSSDLDIEGELSPYKIYGENGVLDLFDELEYTS